tara:strand:+ start:3069 stop:4727 length:1659 start_codon:yes stop_codon:yes gene_type:complete
MKITKSLLKQMIAEEMSEVFQSGLHTMKPSEAHKHYQEAVKDYRVVAGKIQQMLPEEQKMGEGEKAVNITEVAIEEIMELVEFALKNEGMSQQQKDEVLEKAEDLDREGEAVLKVLKIVRETPEELEELVYELHKKYEVAEEYLRGILDPDYKRADPSGADLADSGKQTGLGLQEKDEEEDKVNPDFDRDYDEYGRVYQESKLQQENLDPDKHYLMDGGRVYKGPFDSYEEAEAASDVGGLQIKSPKPKFSKAQRDAADAAKKRFGLEEEEVDEAYRQDPWAGSPFAENPSARVEDPHDKEKVKEAMGYAMSILKHLDFSAQPSIDYDKIRWDLLEGPPTKDALQYAVSTLKDVDFSAVPTVNYDDIRWDLFAAVLEESKKDMLKRIVTEEVVKLELEAMKESGQLDEITVGPSGIKFGGEGGRQDDPADANLDDMSARGVLGRMGSDSEEGRQAKAAMDKFLLRHQNRAEVRAKNKRDQFSAVKDTGERAIIDAARKRSEKLAVNIERIRNSLKDGDLTKEESVYIMSIDGADDLIDYNDDAPQPRDRFGS